jgi:hypothetical protein
MRAAVVDEATPHCSYDSAINALISWLWDGGIDVKVGDELNGYEAEGKVSTPIGSEIRLASTTPDSGFAPKILRVCLICDERSYPDRGGGPRRGSFRIL